ncbi:unnamed protein product [Cylicocyclus nassatus]|uniref:Uncharacterized protein n=1 Tax=Cylicocyclus nassatus TaxID=53992 RepID=A0AA36H916_CYLNA|nr:unnamed protein product [Cylicocyclus nassatus]
MIIFNPTFLLLTILVILSAVDVGFGDYFDDIKNDHWLIALGRIYYYNTASQVDLFSCAFVPRTCSSLWSIRRHFGSNEIVGEQSEEETNNFGELLKIRTVSVIGRASREDQGMKLRMSVEADRMPDMGFEPEAQRFVELLSLDFSILYQAQSTEHEEALINNFPTKEKYRQTVFTATMSPAVERLARAYLWRPAVIYI